ncbi:MAG: FAD-binding oxidoreductase [Solirubrobacteraceae bacterium]
MAADPPSFWLAQEPAGPVRPALEGDARADVCIVGGGLTGLWTAYELRRADPSLGVVVLEARYAGFGASGRNGGWLMGELAGARATWAARHGREAVIAQDRVMRGTIAEVARVLERERIECDWAHGGTLHVAQTPLELKRVRAHVEAMRSWGWADDDLALLDAPQAAQRIAVEGVVGASFTPHCARVHPARLVLGLAAAAERAGAAIFERSRVTGWGDGVVRTAAGRVHTPIVVRATEGYSADLPGLRRTLLPLTSSMIVTDQLDAGTLAALNWQNAETMLDGRNRYAYLQRTADCRVAIGGRGVPYAFGSGTEREGPLPARTARELRDRLVELFPVLRGVGIAAGWHGVLGVARDWMPAVGLDRARGEAWAGGYVGEGVGAANLAGRTLRDLILERDTELTTLPWVGPFARAWEPEPLRWLGVNAVYLLYGAADRREARTRRASVAGRAADALAGRGGLGSA